MATVNMVSENEATGRVKQIYAEIMETYAIDFVPNMFKAMAHRPVFLEAQWKKISAVMREPGKLDPITREVIAVAVSAVLGCDY